MQDQKIKPGNQYRLDGKIIMNVMRSLNRSQTIFAVETADGKILTVESTRLSPVDKAQLPPDSP